MIVLNLELYLDHIKENGYKCIPQRSKILSYFMAQKNRFVSAKSLMDYLRNTTALNLCPMKMMDTSLHDYLIYDHKFEIYGLCPSCR
jgi:Fe2+ or Zn2+ uptake regulation protein